MKLNTTLAALALAIASTSASAATINFGVLDNNSVSFSTDLSAGTVVNDLFNFTLNSPADTAAFGGFINSTKSLVTGLSVELDGTTSFVITSKVQGGTSKQTWDEFFPGLAAGNHFITVKGTVGTLAGNKSSYTFALSAAAVPEPSAWAMMIAGIGMLGFMSVRRRNYF